MKKIKRVADYIQKIEQQVSRADNAIDGGNREEGLDAIQEIQELAAYAASQLEALIKRQERNVRKREAEETNSH